jgi:isocitrate dehydrogenase (NAD+)
MGKTISEKILSEKSGTDARAGDIVVDALTMRLARNPQQYEIIALPNLYGDIVSDLCAGLVGGLGIAPGANMGDNIAIFEPTHGSAPKYAGQNKVNPMAMMLSATMMLRYLGENEVANRLETAIAQVMAEGKKVTYDLKLDRNQPAATTSEVADAVIEKLKNKEEK